MMDKLRESRWVYMLISVALALIFWLYVRTVQDPADMSWIYNVPIQVTGSTVLTRQGLTVGDLSTNTVNLRVEGPTSVLDDLLRHRKDIYVTVDVSKCAAGENKLAYTPVYPPSVNVESVSTTSRNPDFLTVTVEKLYTKTFDVGFQLKGEVAKGYTAGTPAINPETVVISGSVEQVSRVAKVVAILEDQELNERFAGDLPLTLLDTSGQVLEDVEVTMDSETAYVVLPVVVVKEVPLTVNFLPGGGATQENIHYEIDPSSIIVSGAEEDLKDLNELSLGSVELSKVVGTNYFQRPIGLDPSLENVSGITQANIKVTVSGLSSRTFDVYNIILSNVREGYTVTSATQVQTVVVRGEKAELESIDASQLRIVADMSEIVTVGTYSVPVKVYLDANSSVGVIGEYSIVVNISK